MLHSGYGVHLKMKRPGFTHSGCHSKMNSDKPYVTIIIPAYNEERFIERCLCGIAGQIVSNYEVILVDNGSSDDTLEIAEPYVDAILTNKTSNISGLRNIGASKARGELLVFLDADCVPAKDWLLKGIERLKQKEIGVTGSSCLIPLNSTWVEKVWGESKRKGVSEARHIGSANFFIKKDVFVEVDGFNEEMTTGEDYELCQRVAAAGYKIMSDDSIRAVHLRNAKTLKQFLEREIWYGMDTRYVLRRRKFYPPFLLSLLYAGSIITILASFIFSLYPTMVIGLLSLISVLLISSFRKCYVSGSFKYFFSLIFIYFIYFMGRTIGLIYFFARSESVHRVKFL